MRPIFAFLLATTLIVGPFSQADEKMPDGWEPLEFPKVPEHTRYELVEMDGQRVVRATSKASASGLICKKTVDPQEYPILKWRWRVDNVLDAADITSKDGDDYPARIYITFEYDPKKMSGGKKLKYKAARAIYGDLPAGALNYAWASKAGKGDVVDSPYAGAFVKTLVLRTGNAEAGTWREERRNLIEDYRKAFGTDPPPITGVAVMTDTDNTGESVTAYYGDIIFETAEPAAD